MQRSPGAGAHSSAARARWAWVLATALLTILLSTVARDFGDSPEYLAYALAWWDQGVPIIDQAHYAWSRQWHPLRTLPPPHLVGLEKPLGAGASIGPEGFIRLADGRLATFHFWLYSLWVAPWLGLTETLGASPFVAFALANGCAVMLALSRMWVHWPLPVGLKHWASALFLSCGTIYYLPCPHPEASTACLVFFALGEWWFGRKATAAIALGVAATHNPPLLVMLSGVGVSIMRDLFLDAQRTSALAALRSNRRPLLGWGVALGVSTAPVAFFLVFAGVTNPILASGAASWALPSLARVGSTLLDPNSGLVVGAPGAVVLSLGAALCLPRVLCRSLRIRLGALLAAAWFGVLTMAWLSASTANFNHGHLVFSRYAYWLSVVVLVSGLCVVSQLDLRWQWRICSAALVVQAASMTLVLLGGKPWRDYLQFRPPALWLLRSGALAYLPIPEVFAERVLGREVDLASPALHRHIFVLGRPDRAWLLLVPGSSADAVNTRLQPVCEVIPSGVPREGWLYLRPRNPAHCDSRALSPGWTVNYRDPS